MPCSELECVLLLCSHGTYITTRTHTPTTVALFLVFGACMFLFYSVMTVVMTFSSAVVVNLSLLTADVYTLLLGLFLFYYKVRIGSTALLE